MSTKIERTGDKLVITRTFNAERDRVWAAWTEPERLQQWACCAQASSLKVTMDFREGGSHRSIMLINERQIVSFGVYTEIDQPNGFAYTLNWEPCEGMPAPPESTVRVEFKDLDGQTQVSLTHDGLSTDMMRDNVSEGWSTSFSKLEEVLSGAASKVLENAEAQS